MTRSAPKAKPAWVQDGDEDEDRTTQEAGDEDLGNKETHAVIEEPCPKCGHPEQYFYTMQLRSVDEGSTVFYECPKCNNKYSVNN